MFQKVQNNDEDFFLLEGFTPINNGDLTPINDPLENLDIKIDLTKP